MIELRLVESRADLELWARIKSTVVPNEPATADQLRQTAEPDRLLLLASLDGVDAGCGIAGLSSFSGRAFCAARVLEPYRRRGVGTALVRALADHGHALGREGVNAFVDAADEGAITFAHAFGLEETDYQLEQLRRVSPEEQAPAPPAGVGLVSLAGRSEELLQAAWDAVALEGYEDMPLPGPVTYRLDTWLREEATRPDGSFVAVEDGGDRRLCRADRARERPGHRGARPHRRTARPAGPWDRACAQAGPAPLGLARGSARARHLDAERERGHAGAQPQPGVPEHVEGADDAGPAALILLTAGRPPRYVEEVPPRWAALGDEA